MAALTAEHRRLLREIRETAWTEVDQRLLDELTTVRIKANARHSESEMPGRKFADIHRYIAIRCMMKEKVVGLILALADQGPMTLKILNELLGPGAIMEALAWLPITFKPEGR